MAASSTLAPDAYLVVGLSHCFEKNDEGKLTDRMLIEPLSASSMECLATGARTSFRLAAGVTLGSALQRDRASFPVELQEARFCDKWEFRCQAAARTWARPHAMDNLMDLVPLGRTRGQFNFSLDDKRVLNQTVEIKDEDNIKQDMSIDVYGRKDEAKEVAAMAAAEAAAQAAAEAKLAEEDELDSLLGL